MMITETRANLGDNSSFNLHRSNVYRRLILRLAFTVRQPSFGEWISFTELAERKLSFDPHCEKPPMNPLQVTGSALLERDKLWPRGAPRAGNPNHTPANRSARYPSYLSQADPEIQSYV